MCLCLSHSDFILYHPCLIWVLDISCGFLRAWCLEFMSLSVVWSQIYGALIICPSGALGAIGVKRPGRNFSKTPDWQFLRVPRYLNHLMCVGNGFFCACGVYNKMKDQTLFIFVYLRLMHYYRRKLFIQILKIMLDFKNCHFASVYKP